MPIFLIPLILIALYMAERWVFNRFWDQNLSVKLSFPKEAVFEGEKASLTEVITNQNFLPLHILQVHFQTDVGLDFSSASNFSVSDRVNVTDIFSLRFFTRITRELSFNCDKRGYYSILQTNITASDYFSPDIHYNTRLQSTCLYVYPKMVEAPALDSAFKQILGEVVTKRYLYEDTFTFKGIRDYCSSDPMTSINWKATARSGDLKVNIRDYTSKSDVTIILNVEEPGILYETELLENCIRLAYTLSCKLIDQGIPVSLFSNGKDKVNKVPVKVGSGLSKNHITSIQRALARIDLSSQKADSFTADITALLEKEPTPSTTYVYISTSRRDSAVESAKAIADKCGKLLWLCPLTPSMDKEAPSDRRIDFIPLIFQ